MICVVAKYLHGIAQSYRLLFLLFLATAEVTQAAAVSRLSLLPQVAVAGDWITIADLVEHTPEMTQQQRLLLRSVIVGRAPQVSNQRTFTLSQLQRKLENYPALQLTGANEVLVHRQSTQLPAEQIRQALRVDIARQLAVHGLVDDQYRIQGLERIHDLRLPQAEQITVQVVRFQPPLPAASAIAWVDVVDAANNTRLRSLTVPVKLDLVQVVWELTRDLRAGDVIRAQDINAVTMNNAEFQLAAATSPVVGLQLAAPLRKGDALPKALLKPAADFARGQQMVARLNTGTVTLQLPVRLLAPANRGEVTAATRANGRKLKIVIAKDGTAHVIGKYDEQ